MTDVGALVMSMQDLITGSLGDEIAVDFVQHGPSWPALIDPIQMESALLDLCTNARDAMTEGGVLCIETENVHLDSLFASQHPGVTEGDYVMVAVTDSGRGMGAEVRAHAFDPFFTTCQDGRGPGLGLSVVYGFVRQSGGHACILSRLGKGCAIRLYLPRATEAASSDDRALDFNVTPLLAPVQLPTRPLEGVLATTTPCPCMPPKAARPRTGKETILMVEDDDMARGHVGMQLRSLGYEVLLADSGDAALELIEGPAHIDLLLTDVVMPGHGGRQLSVLAQAIRPELPTLFISGYAERSVTLYGEIVWGLHLLRKPYTRKELKSKVRRVLDLRFESSVETPIQLGEFQR
jgi:CheY-like chemotaxis protein